MTTRLFSLLPNADVALTLQPEELGPILLRHLVSLPENERRLHRGNLLQSHLVREYPMDAQEQLLRALNEAWAWLERGGYLIPAIGQSHGWVEVSRTGEALVENSPSSAFPQADLLPRHLVHPNLVASVLPAFNRGEYDAAVLQAFKQVEIAVRIASGADPTDIGVDLMRKAFHKSNGRLTDLSVPEPERDAMSHLFAGAIGAFKNPQSHRSVSLSYPLQAVDLILLASHLLRFVEARTTGARA